MGPISLDEKMEKPLGTFVDNLMNQFQSSNFGHEIGILLRIVD